VPVSGAPADARTTRDVKRARFGVLPNGRPVHRYTLHVGGIELTTIDYGAIITSLCTPDRQGRLADIVLGHDSLDGYLEHSPYFGAVIGRCANRIANGRFTLDGMEYQLDLNDGVNHLHGGYCGFDKLLWDAVPFEHGGDKGVTFMLVSRDGADGYPGTVEVRVTYLLTARGELMVQYAASTDRRTILNLTQHSYFNLSDRAPDILEHELTMRASQFTPIDASLIPTGELRPVAGTPFDFRTAATIGGRIAEAEEQLSFATGYDHNFVLDRDTPNGLTAAARVVAPESGRTLDIRTSEPGVQFYSGNFLDGSIRGKHGRQYVRHAGFCLETQHFPDAPNHPAFPSVVLSPGEAYHSQTVYTFGVDD
jgi:aldose 1-epimerase